jgi:hypothetical protein
VNPKVQADIADALLFPAQQCRRNDLIEYLRGRAFVAGPPGFEGRTVIETRQILASDRAGSKQDDAGDGAEQTHHGFVSGLA